MDKTAKLVVDGKTFELPIVTGSEGERAIDISRLRQETGLITLERLCQHGQLREQHHFYGRRERDSSIPWDTD